MGYIGTALAIISLLLSLYAVRMGRMNRSYDLLFKFYADIRLQEPRPAESIDDIIPPEPGKMDEDERFDRKQNCFFRQEYIETKFNLLCYAVKKRQIPIDDFFALFAPYLQARMEFWPKDNTHRIGNYPYTTWIIDRCIRTGLLPISKNNDYLEGRRGKLRHWKDGAKALAGIHQDMLQKSKASSTSDSSSREC